MATFAPPEVVEGPGRVPLPFGLFSVLAPRSGERWEGGGVTWETLTCDPVGGFGQVECPQSGTPGLEDGKDLAPTNRDQPVASTFGVYGHWTCSPIGNTLESAYERAVGHLELREEARVEQALWTGDLGNVPNLSGANGYPAPDTVGSFDQTDAWRGLAALEQSFALEYGSQGVIHVSREIAVILGKQGVVEVRGGRLYTSLGTPVVAGTGYPSSAMVITGQLIAYRSEVFPGNIGAAGLNRAQNLLTAIAERSWLVGFDECGPKQVTLTLETDN